VSNRPRIAAGALREAKPKHFVIRFAFGAAISLVAGLVSLAFGARAGGVFLAFPAILPATLTLIERRGTKEDVEEDDEGAVLGSVGMVAFAVVAVVTLSRLTSAVALLCASLAWLLCSVGLYCVLALVGRRR
jgi:hypothetical protein